MPNWCQNNLVVRGDPKMLDVIQELEFDFEKILPQPQDLVDDVAPYCAKCKKPYIALNDDPKIERVGRDTCKECNISDNIGGRLGSTMFDKNEDIFKQLNKEETKLAKIWIKKHGTASWYEWNCNTWYTKWNRSNLSMKREDDTTLLGYFATAWGPPYPIFEELCKKFNVVIMLEYDIELGNGKGIMRIDKFGIKELSRGDSENYMNLNSPTNKYNWSKT
jgi:hypothetical protein